jgi:hypothetical protein
VTPQQMSLLDPPRLNARQAEVHEALRLMCRAGTTADIQRTLAEYIPVPRDRNCIAKRLCELEQLGLVERVGRDFGHRGSPTTWRRKP